MLVTHRRPPVLDVPLHRARREHGAHARRELPDLAAAAVGGGGAGRLAGPAVDQRIAAGLRRQARRSAAAAGDGVHGQGREQSVVHRVLPARGARKRPRRARHADDRDLGDHQPDLAGGQPHDRGRRVRARSRAVLRMGEVPLAPVARRHRGHHADGRGAALHAAGHLPRARRQHGAAGRREVPRGAERLLRRRQREGPGVRLLSLERDPAQRLGLRDLPQGLPRRDQARTGGRPADPARRTCRDRCTPA